MTGVHITGAQVHLHGQNKGSTADNTKTGAFAYHFWNTVETLGFSQYITGKI